MKKEIVKYEVVCDSCEKELYDPGVRTNGGKFEESYLKHGNIDLCYECAGKIFYRDIVKKIPEEKLKEFINSLRSINSNPFDIIPQPDTMLFKNRVRTEATLSSLDENVSLEIPGKNTSPVKPVTFLSDL